MRKPKYKIVYGEGENDYETYRTKAEVEKIYRRLLKVYKKDKKYTVIEMNQGWFCYNYLTENYNLMKGECYIARNY